MAPGQRRKVFPYYKVQVFSEQALCWVDGRKAAFDSLKEARQFIRQDLVGKKGRIIVVEENERRVLEESATGSDSE